MAQIIPIRTKSGQIYRFRVTGDLSDLPTSPGIYCFTPPQSYPGGPISPIYWGKAVEDFSTEVMDDPLLREALDLGATHVGTLVVEGRIARKRIGDDLSATFPPSLSAPSPFGRRPSGPVRQMYGRF